MIKSVRLYKEQAKQMELIKKYYYEDKIKYNRVLNKIIDDFFNRVFVEKHPNVFISSDENENQISVDEFIESIKV